MQRNIGFVLSGAAVVAIIWIAYISISTSYYVKTPYSKLITSWTDDVHVLEKSKKLPKEWSEIKELEIKGDNSWPIQDWLGKIRDTKAKPGSEASQKPPIKLNPKGHFKLEVFLVHWIEEYRYGVMLQYHLVDIASKNTIWELDRTYPLGYFY
jgi:hypothetical protein